MPEDRDGDIRREMEWLRAEMKQMRRDMEGTKEPTRLAQASCAPLSTAHASSSISSSSNIPEITVKIKGTVVSPIKREASEGEDYDQAPATEVRNSDIVTRPTILNGALEKDTRNDAAILTSSSHNGLPEVRKDSNYASTSPLRNGHVEKIEEVQKTGWTPQNGDASISSVAKRKRDGDEAAGDLESPKKKSPSSVGGKKEKTFANAPYLDMPQSDADFLLHCIMNTPNGVIVVDAEKVAAAMNYNNIRSVTNRIGQIKKKYGVPIKGGKSSSSRESAGASATTSIATSKPKTPAKEKGVLPKKSRGEGVDDSSSVIAPQ